MGMDSTSEPSTQKSAPAGPRQEHVPPCDEVAQTGVTEERPENTVPSPVAPPAATPQAAERATTRPTPRSSASATPKSKPLRRDEVPAHGRLLGIDFGTKRLGFAVCDLNQTQSAPVDNYTRGDLLQDARKLKQLIEDYRIVGVVVGLPVHMSGGESGKSQESRAFGNWVRNTTGLHVAFWDERYSSAIAEEYLLSAELTKKRRDKRRDMLAAHILLQNFLKARDRTAEPEDLRSIRTPQ
jgi:putative Holliday junction resolvase